MFDLLLCVSLLVGPTTLSLSTNQEPKEKNKTADFYKHVDSFLRKKEYFGSLDYNSQDKLCLYHCPSGSSKPAILFIHPLIFKNKKQVVKFPLPLPLGSSLPITSFDNYLGKNVKIKGEMIIRNGIEYIAVDEIDILILGE